MLTDPPPGYATAVQQFLASDSYSSFVNDCETAFPDWKKLHRLLNAGSDEVGQLLRDYSAYSVYNNPDESMLRKETAERLYQMWRKIWPNRVSTMPPGQPGKRQPPAVKPPVISPPSSIVGQAQQPAA